MTISHLASLQQVLDTSDTICLDIETNGLDVRHDAKFEVRGLAYGGNTGSGYIPLSHKGTENVSRNNLHACIAPVIDTKTWVFHNAKFDLLGLKRYLGLDFYTSDYYDTMLMAHMLFENEPSKELDYLAKKLIGEEKKKSEVMEQIIKTFGWGYIPYDVMAPYAKHDAEITLKLFNHLIPIFRYEYGE